MRLHTDKNSGAETPPVILASASATRAALLSAAAVPFTAKPAGVDEAEIKAALKEDGAPPGEISEVLAETKARQIAVGNSSAVVIGADQILECDGTLFDKPADLAAAREQLRALRGRTHRLWTSACAVRGDQRLWHHTEAPEIHIRAFSDTFLDAYIDGTGETILSSVGAYRLEAEGAQLFDTIAGDYFSILGLPLLPLLRFLRANNIIAE